MADGDRGRGGGGVEGGERSEGRGEMDVEGRRHGDVGVEVIRLRGREGKAASKEEDGEATGITSVAMEWMSGDLLCEGDSCFGSQCEKIFLSLLRFSLITLL